MRKLKLQMQLTVNGFVAGPNGELDWMLWEWDDELKKYVGELTDSIDTIILGRKMTDGFVNHWTTVANNPDDPEYASGKKFVDTPKVVITKTLTESKWENTTLVTGNLKDEISKLKKQKGKDIIVYGGAGTVSNLMKENLIDEYYLFVNPVAIKKGMTIFSDIKNEFRLNLVEAKQFDCGIVLLHYRPAERGK